MRPPPEDERPLPPPLDCEAVERPELDLGADWARGAEELLEETDGEVRGLFVRAGAL